MFQNRSSWMKFFAAAVFAGLVLLTTAVVADDDGKPVNSRAATNAEAITAPAPIVTGHVTSDQGISLVGARVRVAFPAVDMRWVNDRTDCQIWETTTGEQGVFLLELSGITKPGKIAIDVRAP